MPKIPSIPRISIVVPVGANIPSFEDTLVSVLQNRPAGCEILVSHDGNYDDPFDLTDEVRFVQSDSSSSVDLIAAGANAALGRFVHVLTPGFYAIEDWTKPALEMFDQGDVAVVAPVIRENSGLVEGKVVAAGWQDTQSRLCQALGKDTSKRNQSGVTGAYLQASFWRRDVLRSLANAFQSQSLAESTYAFGHLVKRAGWRCMVAEASEVITDLTADQWDTSSFNRGRQLRAVRAAITRSEKRMSLIASLFRAITNPSTIGEALGQASYRGRLASTKRRLQISAVTTFEDSSIITMPRNDARAANAAVRRAA